MAKKGECLFPTLVTAQNDLDTESLRRIYSGDFKVLKNRRTKREGKSSLRKNYFNNSTEHS